MCLRIQMYVMNEKFDIYKSVVSTTRWGLKEGRLSETESLLCSIKGVCQWRSVGTTENMW